MAQERCGKEICRNEKPIGRIVVQNGKHNGLYRWLHYREGKEDSACGWACKLMWNGNVLVKSGSDIGRTNNQMEMRAVLEAMRSITKKSIPVEVYSDSKYVVETLNGKYRMHKNEGLWHSLLIEKAKFKDIKFIWVKGHDKDQHNK